MYRHHRRKISSPEEGYIPPFAITDNVYFVGTHQSSSHMIDTGDGLILIDTGYKNTAEMVLASVRALGFDPANIKYIIHTHHHDDHMAATLAIVRETGAKTVISKLDHPIALAQHGIDSDLTVEDGDTLSLGNTEIRFVLTPGHTVGTLSLFFDTTYLGKTYRAGTFGGAGVNTMVPEHCDFYPTCREDFANSLVRLERERVDVFIGNHVWNNDTEEKGKRLLAGGKNEFIDKGEWKKFLIARRDVLLSLAPLDTL